MNEQVKEYLEKYSDEIRSMFAELRMIIIESVQCVPREALWAKMPTFYVGDSFVRLVSIVAFVFGYLGTALGFELMNWPQLGPIASIIVMGSAIITSLEKK